MESFIERPAAPSAGRQLLVFVLDGSPSMLDAVEATAGWRGSKGEAVAAAVGDLLEHVRVSSRAASTSVGCVTFAGHVTGARGPVPLTAYGTAADHDPTRLGGTGTSLAAGLAGAEQQIGPFLASGAGRPASAVVLMLTDGLCETPDESRRVAGRLREDPRVTVACAQFATRGRPQRGRRLLQHIGSAPPHIWTTTADAPGTLLLFFRENLAMASSSAQESFSAT